MQKTRRDMSRLRARYLDVGMDGKRKGRAVKSLICLLNQHEFDVLYCDILGNYQKGLREAFTTVGDVAKCVNCGETRFFPINKELMPVDVEVTG